MASVAGDPSGVVRRGDLGKIFRLGTVGLVTPGTQDRCIQLLGLHRTGIVGVPGEGSVASLARNYHVLTELLLIRNVGMAGFTSVVPRKRNRPGRDFGDRRPSIVAILPKTARHKRAAQNHEYDQCDGHGDRQPNEVFNVLEQVRALRVIRPCKLLRRKIA